MEQSLLCRAPGDAKASGEDAEAWQVYVNVCKGMAGAGSFSLPFAFRQMGLSAGALTLPAAAVLGLFGLDLQLELKYAMGSGRRRETLQDLASFALGPLGAAVAVFAIVVGQVGTCAAYLKFFGDALSSLLPRLGPWQIPPWRYMTMCLPVATALTFIRSMRVWSVASTVGVVALVLGLCCTLAFGFRNYSVGPLEEYAQCDASRYFYGFGSAAFLFNTSWYLLVERALKGTSQSRGRRFVRTATASMLTVLALNLAFGALAYMLFSTDEYAMGTPCSNVVLNLREAVDPSAGWTLAAVKLALCVDLLASYPIMFEAAADILERELGISGPEGHGGVFASCATRAGLSVLALLLAQIDEFGVLTDILGGMTCGVATFVLPGACWFFARRRHPELDWRSPAGRLKTWMGIGAAALMLPVCIATTVYAVHAASHELYEPSFCTVANPKSGSG